MIYVLVTGYTGKGWFEKTDKYEFKTMDEAVRFVSVLRVKTLDPKVSYIARICDHNGECEDIVW
jgi:hypothetical protein